MVVIHGFGAWDFPLSRSEKIRLLVTGLGRDSDELREELREKEATIRKLQKFVEKDAFCYSCGVKRPALDTPKAPRGPPKRTVSLQKANDEEPHSADHASPPPTPPTLPLNSCWLEQPFHTPSAASPPFEEGLDTLQVPRRRRRTTVFAQLPPEPDGEANEAESSCSQPMRARRCTAPPSAAVLAAAQAAGEAHMADILTKGAAEWRQNSAKKQALSSFTPPSSGHPSPACTPRLRPRCASPPPPPRSPPMAPGLSARRCPSVVRVQAADLVQNSPSPSPMKPGQWHGT